MTEDDVNDVKMTDECQVFQLLDPQIRNYFLKDLGHSQLTAVQIEQSKAPCKIIALIIVPGRELVNQIFQLCRPICSKLEFRLIRMFGSSGSRKKKMKLDVDYFKGNWFDVCSVLSVLPKQRRSALFSATEMADQYEAKINEIARFGLRNPLKLTFGSDNNIQLNNEKDLNNSKNEEDNEDEEEKINEEETLVTPKELINYYACVPAEFKFLAMIKFLKSQRDEKILVFCSNAAQCEYFGIIVRSLLEDNERVVMEMHRKMEGKRQKMLDLFRSTKRAILFSTDVLARGIDVLDIDWVLQYDFPKLSKLFVHRSGRAGRMGRKGKSLLLLTKEESAYIQFLEKQEKVVLEESEFGGLNNEKAQKIREKIQQMASEDRKVLELGTAAFVSFIESYNRHDTQIVCKVKDLDVVGLANSFGLVRFPKIRELVGRQELVANFKPRMDIKIHEIKYKDDKLENKRLEMEAKNQKKSEKHERRMKRKAAGDGGGQQKMFKRGKMIKGKTTNMEELNNANNEDDDDQSSIEDNNKQQNGGKSSKKKRKQPEWEQLQKGEKLLKNFKKGKITKTELEDEMDEAFD
uniref:ATP-dependent RNA helicase n=1 Tax=Meloidogyne hapla TaxID=6305 RepID=A0A1I8B4B4_MELHA